MMLSHKQSQMIMLSKILGKIEHVIISATHPHKISSNCKHLKTQHTLFMLTVHNMLALPRFQGE